MYDLFSNYSQEGLRCSYLLDKKCLSEALRQCANQGTPANLLRQAIASSALVEIAPPESDFIVRQRRRYLASEVPDENAPTVQLEGSDREEMVELLRHHPYAVLKIGILF